jgi:hypothetical protein
MEMPYFEAALRRIEARSDLPPGITLLVLTDDVPWARAQRGLTARGARVVDGEDEVASLYLLAACTRAKVCSNSTFCWWAAFLARAFSAAFGDGSVGPVYMPKSWIRGFDGGAELLRFTEGIEQIADEDFVAA